MIHKNHERLYQREQDPWRIGAADSDRYNFYRAWILGATKGGSVLDLGCGNGAFLARVASNFQNVFGVDISYTAIGQARKSHPDWTLLVRSVTNLDKSSLDGQQFDCIILSDVIYYVWRKRKVMKWIAEHLRSDGVALIAAYCPGGKYPTPEKLQRLVSKYLDIERQQVLESDHAIFLSRRKRKIVAITVDYETWDPVPKGKVRDWDRDVFEPANKLFGLGIPLTLMAEMMQYWWLKKTNGSIADRMFNQWRKAIEAGHDVQLHLHPGFPNGYMKLDDYPGDLHQLIKKSKAELEKLGHRVIVFRAGGYQAQPFERLYLALARNGIRFDTSVWPGQKSSERGYDYTRAISEPHLADPTDPGNVSSHSLIIELPISSHRIESSRALSLICLHTKGDQNWELLKSQIRELKRQGVEFITLSKFAQYAEQKVNAIRWKFDRMLDILLDTHNSLLPGYCRFFDWRKILKCGYALCDGYSIVLGKRLQREGFKVRWVTMRAENHPQGRGPKYEDSHELLEVNLVGKVYTLDATIGCYFPHSVEELLKHPLRAIPIELVKNEFPFYSTHFWYCRVVKYAYRKRFRSFVPIRFRWRKPK